MRNYAGLNSVGGAPWRSQVWQTSLLLFLFWCLPIDGYPAGAHALREFGARPTNFFLAAALVVWIVRDVASGKVLLLSRNRFALSCVVLLGIPAINLPIAVLLQPDTPTGALLADWSKQYAMFLWGLTSFFVWRRLLRNLKPERLAALMCLGTVIPLIAFFGDFVGSGWVQGLLGTVRSIVLPRPSGLATEPSLYAAWLAFVWPFVLFYSRRATKRFARLLAFISLAALAASAVLGNARTMAVIIVFQMVFFVYLVTKRTQGLRRVRSLVIAFTIAVAVVLAFAAQLSSLADTDVGTNISRFGSTVTAIRVAAAYPIAGIGIGQLRYFFGAYAPDFALASDEILAHATGLTDYRASSFNLFIRLFCEFGLGVGAWFSYVVVHPLIVGVRSSVSDDFLPYATLSAIGGVGFWLSQDQYGYQPAILSLAVLDNALSAYFKMHLSRYV